MGMLRERPTLLSIDDDEEIGKVILAVADRAGFEAAVVDTLNDFHEQLGHGPDIVVLDLQMPGTDGIEIIRLLSEAKCESSIVLVTGMDARTVASAEKFAVARGLRVIGAVQKPFMPEELEGVFRRARSLARPLDGDDLAEAIKREQMAVYYQPVLRRFADGWDIDGVEALLRWEHPERGVLTPYHFLDLGDEEIMRQMTDYVIREGLYQLKGWYAGKLQLGLRLNLSASLLVDIEFPDRLDFALREQDIDASAVTLEVNETGMLEEHPETYDILTRLRLKGVRLAIDDFGIGYSSLTQLFRLPFCEMKIDRALIADVPGSPEVSTTVEALVDLAHKLGIEVCGEGVETVETLGFLERAGCDSAQGYLVSRPVRPREIPGLVRSWHDRRAFLSEGGGTDERAGSEERGPRQAV